jgi:tripartite-type tricarboxylate transporter receptor subunit TctC
MFKNKYLKLISLCMLLAAGSAQAQQKITRLVIFAAGGPTEFIARTLAAKLGPLLGGIVVVDTRPGANGAVAAHSVVNATPDGSTLLFASAGLLTITPTLQKDLSYDTDRDLTPVSRVTINASAVAISSAVPANNIKEFVGYVRASKEPVGFGSAGIGNLTHLWLEQFNSATKLEILHVPYKGIAPAMQDIFGGRLAGAIADFPAFVPHVKSGRMKVLGMVGAQRNAAVPDIPTLHEQGFPGVDALSWYSVLAHAKTPPDVLARLNDAIARALADAEIREKYLAMGSVASSSSPAEMAKLIQSERARFAKIIAERKITVD